jgi:response regulator RpfG family c-di-GMP phosphodiesterase
MKILIVDDEIDILEIVEYIVLEKFPTGVQTIHASSGNEAIKILAKNQDIDICICDHNISDGMGSVVLKYLVEAKSKTKFVLCSTILPEERPLDYPGNLIFSNIQKPNIENGLSYLLRLLGNIEVKPKASADEFIPINIHILSLLGSAPSDVYIRMSDNKFIKCLNFSEEFTSADKEKYFQKSINDLFIKKGQHPAGNHVILESVQKIMERRNLPLSDKMGMAHSQLVGVIKFSGMTPELAEATKENIQQSVAHIMKSNIVLDFWKDINLLGEYPSRLYVLHSMLATMVMSRLNWNSEASVYKLTLSAFLQDITLDSIPMMEITDYKEFIERESRFTEAEIIKFKEHPLKAVEILSTFVDVPLEVDDILLDQHEMPDGSGFPRSLNANQLNPLSCVFILTGIFARKVLKEKSTFNINIFIPCLEKRGYGNGNFKEAFGVIKGMQKT